MGPRVLAALRGEGQADLCTRRRPEASFFLREVVAVDPEKLGTLAAFWTIPSDELAIPGFALPAYLRERLDRDGAELAETWEMETQYSYERTALLPSERRDEYRAACEFRERRGRFRRWPNAPTRTQMREALSEVERSAPPKQRAVIAAMRRAVDDGAYLRPVDALRAAGLDGDWSTFQSAQRRAEVRLRRTCKV